MEQEPELPPRALQAFEGFVTDTPETKWALDEAKSIVAEWHARRSPRWLSLLGVSGVGKTHLAQAIQKAAKENSWDSSVQFRKWTAILGAFRKGQWEVKDFMIGYPFLIIDDIGAAHETPFAQSFADELADRRMGKWTVWTSNYTLEQVGDELSHRVRSRMRREGNKVVEFVDTADFTERQDQLRK